MAFDAGMCSARSDLSGAVFETRALDKLIPDWREKNAPLNTPATSERGVRKERVGVVISDKMSRTLVVRAERRLRHPLYGKEIKRARKYYVHDPEGAAAVGDVVRIEETRPISRLKRWRLVGVVRKAQG